MSPAIFSFLPLDLLDVILHYVRRADLTSICRTSKLFRVHALDALYSDMRLADNHSLQACFSILDDPQLAARVKRFAIYSNNTAGSFYGVIQDTLEVLPGLETLELSMGEGSSCQWLLPTNSCPFLLHTFLTDFPYTPEVQTFITSQPGIRNLTVPWASGVNYFGNLGFLGLRYLTTIFAPFSLVEALVPGRPIREVITFQDREDIHPDRISCLSKSTSISGIKRLQITAGFLRDIGPELLSKTLPSLSCLSVISY
ncbi:hypothetical protein C8F04DRAFT_1097508 [Mycena alexandri]|uniref:F-box domain-containing protein n=1 Tax=Mycena alexandri TaxID=1745969 RepID=A0AAD6X3P2_9AGAR|nr:hypothetical protein C8F04DRAFT_1097508 [Mycena alexandri]